MTLATDLPAKLTLTPQLPELRGTSKSNFEFQLGIKNDSGKKVVVSLSATAPQNFDAIVHRAVRQPGAQCAAARRRPVEGRQAQGPAAEHGRGRQVQGGGQGLGRGRHRRPPSSCIDITGQPKIDIAGREGVLSAQASAGREAIDPRDPHQFRHRGRPSRSSCRARAPSGWKIEFDPKTIDRIAPNENKEVQALVTPTDKAVAGDYVTTVRAAARGESASQTFRVAVTTSTLWGIVGVGLIGVALLVMVGAVVWFGRR